MKKEYKSLSKYYDLLHNKRNYEDEALFFMNLINKYKKSKGNSLLDVACGTGTHISYFKNKFRVEGIDLSKELIKMAREKNKDIKFKVGDMRKLTDRKQYDAITVLFSSIAYLRNEEEIIKTLRNFHKILNSGGIILIETVFLKDSLKDVKAHVREYSDDSVSIRRLLDITIEKDLAEVKARYLIKEKNKKEREVMDKQVVSLLAKERLVQDMQEIGFDVKTLKYKKTGTTIFICMKNSS